MTKSTNTNGLILFSITYTVYLICMNEQCDI